MKALSISLAGVALSLLFAQHCGAGQGVYAVQGPWLDERSQVFALESLTGSYSVVTMAYGACRRVCSSSLKIVRDVAELAARRHVPLRILVVGLDPAEDKPADWAAYRAERKLSFGNLDFLSGTPSSVRQLAQKIGEKYWRYGEHTMHDFRVVLISPEGRVVKAIDRFDQEASELMP